MWHRCEATPPVVGQFDGVGDIMKVLEEWEIMIGMLLAQMLETMGHDVCAIEATEADAVTAVVRCRPDLMIVDARLGDGSGVSAVEEILRTGFVPHVFISGDTGGAQ